MTSTILSLTCLILCLMGAGLVAGRTGCLNKAVQAGLSNLLMNYSLPAAILLSAEGPLSPDQLAGMGWMLALSAGYFLVVFPLAVRAGRQIGGLPARRQQFASGLIFANVGFLGFPVADALFPESGLFYAAFFNLVFNLVFFTAGERLFRPDGRMGSPRVLLTNPNLIATAVMSLFLALNWHLPALLRQPVEMLGDLCAPLSLLLVGARLAEYRPRELLAGRALKLAAALRLLAIPLAAVPVLWLLRAPAEAAMVLVVMCAMPGAATTVISAQAHGQDPDFAARSVALTSFLFPATLPLVLLAAQAVLG